MKDNKFESNIMINFLFLKFNNILGIVTVIEMQRDFTQRLNAQHITVPSCVRVRKQQKEKDNIIYNKRRRFHYCLRMKSVGNSHKY